MLKRHAGPFKGYALGLTCTFVGSWLTGVTGSTFPLAMGAAALLMATVPLVKAIWSGGSEQDCGG